MGDILHAFQSGVADGADTTLIRPSNWNASHTLSGPVEIPLTSTLNDVINADSGVIIPDKYEIANGNSLEVGIGAVMLIL